MRLLVPLLTLVLSAVDLFAQEQESKLIDRLLKPNTSLKNSAEGKRFVTTSAVPTDKQIAAPSFSFRKKSQTKAFPHQRALTAKEVPARRSPAGDSIADVSTRSRPARADTAISPSTVQVQIAPESVTALPQREFAGNRSFLAEGKSQRSLRTKNKPLTIEQVRELLNKSK